MYDLDGHSWQGREQELDVGLAVTCLLRAAWWSRQPIQLRGVDEIRKAALERLLHFVSNWRIEAAAMLLSAGLPVRSDWGTSGTRPSASARRAIANSILVGGITGARDELCRASRGEEPRSRHPRGDRRERHHLD